MTKTPDRIFAWRGSLLDLWSKKRPSTQYISRNKLGDKDIGEYLLSTPEREYAEELRDALKGLLEAQLYLHYDEGYEEAVRRAEKVLDVVTLRRQCGNPDPVFSDCASEQGFIKILADDSKDFIAHVSKKQTRGDKR